jgi:hypothetical protein
VLIGVIRPAITNRRGSFGSPYSFFFSFFFTYGCSWVKKLCSPPLPRAWEH